MRAMVFDAQGAPEVLRLERNWPLPEPGPGQARLRVHACGVNWADTSIRSGRALPRPMPHIGGLDAAGEIDAIGPGDPQGYEVGQRVLAHFGLTCGVCERCVKGEETRCLNYGIAGVANQGGHAEYTVQPLRGLLPLPEGLSYEDAAAQGCATTTAWHMLVSRAEVRPGEDVLVLAAGSGVGVASIQIAKLSGARVIAAASSGGKLERARALGADLLINYVETDFAEEVLRLTDGRGVDVVVESVGAATWERSLRSACKGGRITWVGTTSGQDVTMDLRPIYSRELSLLGSTSATRAEARTVLALTAQGRLRTVIDRVLPLDELPEAHRAMERREQFGKIIITP